ncbi:actin cytoskeleton-regulatory complex protein END3 [Apiospora arundinis]
MQFFTITTLAFLVAGAIAMPTEGATENHLEARKGCKADHPACQGGRVTGQTNCRCGGQVGPCDVMQCPGDGKNTVMVCGQQGTGCVWI